MPIADQSSKIDKDQLERALRPAGRRRVFGALGFQIGDRQPGSDGWISGIPGPDELGEGAEGSFNVNVETGASRDHSRSSYSDETFRWPRVGPTRGRSGDAEGPLACFADGRSSPPKRRKRPVASGGALGTLLIHCHLQ